MTNPNNNMNAYKQALQINRDLKRENGRLKDELERKELLYQDWLKEYEKWEKENAQKTTDE